MFTKETYVSRRAGLLDRMKGENGIILFIGNVNSPAQYRDNCYKWRQDSNWLYFFGIDEPGFSAVIDIDSGEETVFADDVSLEDMIWTGPVDSVATMAAAVGIDRTQPASKLSWVISSAIMQNRRIHFLPASRYYNALRLSSLLGIEPYEAFSKGKSGCPAASAPLVNAVISLRLIKTAEEIDLLDKACILGQEMHTIARKGIRPGRIEQEIVGEMEAVALGKGWGISFQTILTQHGETFHSHSHDLPLEAGKLLVIDAGVESNEHYASDFTRTYPVSGKFTSRQRDIYQIVFECNELAFSLTKPGTAYYDVHQAVARLLLERLSDLSIVHGNVDDMLECGVAGLFLPHGLGHNIGLDVHDMEDLGENLVGYDSDQQRSSQLGLCSLRMARRLVPGNVISDEPGIYFIPALIADWKKNGTDRGTVNYSTLESYLDFGGIRLEDDVLVTEDGARRLGGERLPISPDDVEKAMAND